MSRNGSGVYSLPPGLPSNGDTSDVSDIVTPLTDLETDMNTARPVVAGGTGSSTVSGARTNLGLGAASTKGVTGSDANAVTGTAGTENYVAKWNADGDLVDGPEVLDEDDMTSDAADKLATQQSIKAYVDAAIQGSEQGPENLDTLTSYDFTGISSSTTQITVMLNDASLSGTEDILIQIGPSGGIVSTGYICDYSTHNASSSGTSSSTSGFLIPLNAAGREANGVLTLTKEPTTNTWFAGGTFSRNGTGIAADVAGRIDLAGALTQVRITRTGSDTFDAGTVSIRARA